MLDDLPRADLETHWDTAYVRRGGSGVSWYQESPQTSVQLISALDLPLDAAIIDVGCGTSTLIDHLVREGRTDLTALDISERALRTAKARIGDSTAIAWLHEDLLRWQPSRLYDLWHDRAVFHFLVNRLDQEAYLAKLHSALGPAGCVIIGVFAPDGPEQCSGLPVSRYSSDALADLLGQNFDVVETRREGHRTPAGTYQPFVWLAARRHFARPGDSSAS